MKKLMILLALLALVPVANAAEKEWTFLVYLNGNNSLDSFGPLNINQMEKVGSNDQLNIVVQWASMQKHKTVRMLVNKDNDFNNVTSPVVEDLGNIDMGDYRTLEAFIKWGMEKYPAKHYFVNVWDHGSGWRYMNSLQGGGMHINDISWDDNTGNSMTTKQLGQVIQNVAKDTGKKIDIYGSDACLMAMAEVAGEMKDAVSYFVGSQYLEPGAGWPYDMFLQHFVDNPSISPRDVSIALTDEYVKSYQGGSNGTNDATFSTLDMSKYNEFEGSVRKLGQAITQLSADGKSKILGAAKSTMSFTYSDYGDFGDFLNLMGGVKDTGLDARVISEVKGAMDGFVVDNKDTSYYAKATGVSIWLPRDKSTYDSYKGKYSELVFEAGTHWSSALESFVK